MGKLKFKSDKAGNFAGKGTLDISPMGIDAANSKNIKVWVKLNSPKDANIKVLTLTISKKTFNTPVPKGKLVTVGPYPLVAGSNPVSFDGGSDAPDAAFEIEVTPQLLK